MKNQDNPSHKTASEENSLAEKGDLPLAGDPAAAPADSLLSTPRRQHPVAAFTFILRTLREMIIPILVFFFLGQREDSPFFNIYVLLLMLAVLLLIGIVNWLRFTWRIENEELRIEEGLLVRKKKYLPSDRIQAIDISSGPIQRLFGLVRINVLTAGGSQKDAEIHALSHEDARAIQKALQGNGHPSGRTTADTSWPIYKLSKKRLLIAASTAGSFGIALSIVGTLMAHVNQAVSEEQMIAFVEAYAQGLTVDFWITLALAAILIAWLLSLFGTMIRFSGFTLTRNEHELQIRRGLFEKKQITLPYHRIQAVRVVEGIFRQPFGYAMLYVENAGFGDEAGKTTVVFPLIRKKELSEFLSRMLPEYNISLPGVRPPGRAFLRYQFRVVLPPLLIISALAWYFSLFLLIPLVFVLATATGYLRYKDAAAGFCAGLGFMRFRRLARSTVFFHRKRIQSISVLANWFQRRKALCSLRVTVASGKGGVDFQVDHLDERVHKEWQDWYGSGHLISRPEKPMGLWPDWGEPHYSIAENQEVQ